MSRLGLVVRGIAGVYNWLVGTVVMAVGGAPAYLFVRWSWPRLANDNALVEALLRSGSLFVAYLVFGLSMLAGIVVISRVFRLRANAGRFTMSDLRLFGYFTYNLMIVAARFFALPIFRFSFIQVWFYRGMGARIGRNVVINSVHVYDLNLLTFEDHAIVGGSAKIMAHAGQGNRVYIAPVHLGKGATVGESAIVMPGATIGDGAIIGAGSVVPVDFEVPPNTRWRGVPIERIEGAPE